MDNTNNITISKYINGELAGEELTAFESLLQQDKALADEVNFHKIVDETLAENYKATSAIDENERLEFEGTLSKVMEDGNITEGKRGEQNTSTSQNNSNTIIRRLIPFVALAAAASVFFFIINQSNLSSLADENYVHYPYLVEPELGDGDLNIGIEAYQEKDYETALNIFNSNPSGDLKLKLAKGNAEYNLGKYDEAINSFNEVRELTGNPSFKNYANWYLALTYLKKDDKNQAIKLLKQLPEGAASYKQAQDLVKELK